MTAVTSTESTSSATRLGQRVLRRVQGLVEHAEADRPEPAEQPDQGQPEVRRRRHQGRKRDALGRPEGPRQARHLRRGRREDRPSTRWPTDQGGLRLDLERTVERLDRERARRSRERHQHDVAEPSEPGQQHPRPAEGDQRRQRLAEGRVQKRVQLQVAPEQLGALGGSTTSVSSSRPMTRTRSSRFAPA